MKELVTSLQLSCSRETDEEALAAQTGTLPQEPPKYLKDSILTCKASYKKLLADHTAAMRECGPSSLTRF